MADRDSGGGEPARRSAREIARRNQDAVGKPLSPVMKTAATACELAAGAANVRRDEANAER
jgi:hypothetical protein